jgi:YD repeat-containing protein
LAGNQTAATDARGHTTAFIYNALNELTKQIEPVDCSTSITTLRAVQSAADIGQGKLHADEILALIATLTGCVALRDQQDDLLRRIC